jgi:predicted oxidoreductase
MKKVSLGKTDLKVTRIAYGCWRLAGTWNKNEVSPAAIENGRKAVKTALDSGITFFDHADIYCDGVAESIFGGFLKENPGIRPQIQIATKCGIRWAGDPEPSAPHRYDFSARHIIWSCEQSLKRLQTDYLDLYQLHRPDVLCDPHEVAEAFVKLKESGKVLHFGVSNFKPSQVEMLQAWCSFPIVVNQVEISLMHLDCFYDGTLDQCIARQITPLAWSPLAGGLLGTGFSPAPITKNCGDILRVHRMLDNIASKYGTTRTVIALAWLMKHPSGIVPIIGSTNPDRIHESIKADDVELTREDWYNLFLAARGEKLP